MEAIFQLLLFMDSFIYITFIQFDWSDKVVICLTLRKSDAGKWNNHFSSIILSHSESCVHNMRRVAYTQRGCKVLQCHLHLFQYFLYTFCNGRDVFNPIGRGGVPCLKFEWPTLPDKSWTIFRKVLENYHLNSRDYTGAVSQPVSTVSQSITESLRQLYCILIVTWTVVCK